MINLLFPAQLISAFVFASCIVRSLFYLKPKFQASSHLLWLYIPVCVGPGRRFSHNEAHFINELYNMMVCVFSLYYQGFALRPVAVTAQLISAFVFAIRIVQSLYYLNPKFQASSHLLWLYSPVCVGPGRKPRRPVFSQRGSE